MKKVFFSVIVCLVGVVMICGMGWAKKGTFSGQMENRPLILQAQNIKCIVSNVSQSCY